MFILAVFTLWPLAQMTSQITVEVETTTSTTAVVSFLGLSSMKPRPTYFNSLLSQ